MTGIRFLQMGEWSNSVAPGPQAWSIEESETGMTSFVAPNRAGLILAGRAKTGIFVDGERAVVPVKKRA